MSIRFKPSSAVFAGSPPVASSPLGVGESAVKIQTRIAARIDMPQSHPCKKILNL